MFKTCTLNKRKIIHKLIIKLIIQIDTSVVWLWICDAKPIHKMFRVNWDTKSDYRCCFFSNPQQNHFQWLPVSGKDDSPDCQDVLEYQYRTLVKVNQRFFVGRYLAGWYWWFTRKWVVRDVTKARKFNFGHPGWSGLVFLFRILHSLGGYRVQWTWAMYCWSVRWCNRWSWKHDNLSKLFVTGSCYPAGNKDGGKVSLVPYLALLFCLCVPLWWLLRVCTSIQVHR